MIIFHWLTKVPHDNRKTTRTTKHTGDSFFSLHATGGRLILSNCFLHSIFCVYTHRPKPACVVGTKRASPGALTVHVAKRPACRLAPPWCRADLLITEVTPRVAQRALIIILTEIAAPPAHALFAATLVASIGEAFLVLGAVLSAVAATEAVGARGAVPCLIAIGVDDARFRTGGPSDAAPQLVTETALQRLAVVVGETWGQADRVGGVDPVEQTNGYEGNGSEAGNRVSLKHFKYPRAYL